MGTPSHSSTARVPALLAALAATALSLSALPSNAARPTPEAKPNLAPAFQAAAAKYDVPREVLVGVGYAETHLDGHNGRPSQANGYGVMHLASNNVNATLSEAAKLTGVPAATLEKDNTSNILGAAAVLDSYADHAGLTGAARKDVAKWYGVVAKYSHSADGPTARLYTDEVYRIIGTGVHAAGVTTAPKPVTPDRGAYAKVSPLGKQSAVTAADYPGAIWNPACTCNYQAGRTAAITTIVIHVTQGSYAGTISWFKDPAAQVSAHYVVRSSDGQITQMVAEKDTAWHARSANPYAIGIEHEGYIDQPSWFTDAMYRSSAALTRNIADRRGIPKDRNHIKGHSEMPGNDHTDPGPNWNWTYYMQLVNGGDPNPPTYNFTTWGNGVNVRATPRLNGAVVTTLPGPTQVYVECQVQGDTVTAAGYTNNWWSKLRDQGGYLTNIYIDDPNPKLPGVPVCT